jgi:hypothetical protein
MQVAECPQEGLLRDILGIVTPAEHSQTESEDHVFKSLDELPLASHLAGQATLD